MNKLKRPLPNSPTKVPFTSAVQVIGTSVSTKYSLDHNGTIPVPPDDVTPRSRVEQYWAARALTAEALLSARTEHHRELRTLSFGEELKRSVSWLFVSVFLNYNDLGSGNGMLS